MDGNKIYSLAINPWVVLGCLAAGIATGMAAPATGMALGFIGDIYVDLLKMVTLPFMVSAVVWSMTCTVC